MYITKLCLTGDEYYDRWKDINSLLARAYTDVAILRKIASSGMRAEMSQIPCIDSGITLISHIDNLLLFDLAMILWKINDRDGKSNTLNTLNAYVRKKFTDKEIKMESLSKSSKKTLEDLEKIRDKYLAHNDIIKSGVQIKLATLEQLLNESKDMFNAMTFESKEKGICKMSSDVVEQILYEVELGSELLSYSVAKQFYNTHDAE